MTYSGKFLFFLLLFATCLGSPPGICEDAGDPVTVRERQLNEVKGNEPKKNAGVWLASFFRDVISPVDGDRCPSLPTCSSYSVSAFKKHGFVTGWLMTVDRLIHEGDEWSVSPRVYHKGRLRTLECKDGNSRGLRASAAISRTVNRPLLSMPLSVISTVCSNWALNFPSSVTAVQSFSRMCRKRLPILIIGSIVNTIPGRSLSPWPFLP